MIWEVGASQQAVRRSLSSAMIALGLGAVLQDWWRGPIGWVYPAHISTLGRVILADNLF